MKEQAKSKELETNEFVFGMSVLIDPRKRAQINRISQLVLSPQAKKAEKYLEYSTNSLMLNLLGFTGIRFARGIRPQVHELRHRWSRPFYLFFASATIINLLGTAFCTYDFVTKSGDHLKEIVHISKNNSIKKTAKSNSQNQPQIPTIDTPEAIQPNFQIKQSQRRANE